MGVSIVEAIDDALFDGLPSSFPVIQTHMDAVNKAPEGTLVIAANEQTPIQALAVGDTTRTVQWHPEFTPEIIRGYIHARAHIIEAEVGAEGLQKMLESVGPVDSGPTILRNFADHFLGAP